MNIFGVVLSIFILCFLLYCGFFVFFNTGINGYARVAATFLIIVGIIFYILYFMKRFWF